MKWQLINTKINQRFMSKVMNRLTVFQECHKVKCTVSISISIEVGRFVRLLVRVFTYVHV